MHGASRSMRLFSFPTEFIQSSYPDDEQSSSDLFLTPHPLSSSLSDRQESNATDRLTGQGCVKVLGGGGVEQCWVDRGLMFKLFSPSLGREQSCFCFEGQSTALCFFFFFWQKPDKFLATIEVGKKDRMELVSVFSTGCASHRGRGRKGLWAIGDRRDGGCWSACIASAGTGGFIIGKRGCTVSVPIHL